ncbi:hypothetical protein DM01DRAFT_1381319 [Hesseltinella vesiculosa]|uniref:Amino acid permease/ SLC12A domain-containing protein n=1 Tax=Hesseltinella vesiculosa TaxID=101127 RepID=A0A1X2GRV7_9FUNG|nr:hypothetical protein DM01DRAFT_1381319 [Hesseltinella vesiculosa]
MAHYDEKVELPSDQSSVSIEDQRETQEPKQELKRQLASRHLTMIAVGGSIGTGLFLSTGASISEAGPGGCFISYVLVGLMVYSIVMSLGEMSAYMPIPGAFNSFGSRFVDPALGFTLGWNYWAQWALSIPTELTAAEIIIQFWAPNVPTWVWGIVIIVPMFLINLINVRVYGEVEYWLSIIKVLVVIIFIIVGILVNVGAAGSQGYIGVSNWQLDGSAPTFTGIFSVIIYAFYSFGGTELVGITAGESKNPAKDVPSAIRVTFWRIFIFFILAVLVISLDIPYTDPDLYSALENSDISVSPFTLVFQNAGLSSAASVMNGVILTAVLSATNSCFYASSRTLMAMANEGKAPRIFGRVNRNGIPIYSVLLTTLIAALCFLGTIWGNGVVFSWLVALPAISAILTWLSISVIHLRFRAAFKAQGRSLDDLPYRSFLFPYLPILSILLALLVFASYCYTINYSSASAIVNSYISVVVFFGLLFGYKLFRRTHIVPLTEIDLDTGRSDYRPGQLDPTPAKKKWFRWFLDWFI